jgi:hypothetical protein
VNASRCSATGEKILCLAGSDLDPAAAKHALIRAHRDGYTIFAMDSAAVEAAVKGGVPYTVLEDWVDAGTIGRVFEVADSCRTNWFEAGREWFTVEGVCWPELDHVVMREFWQDVIMAEALAEVFSARGCGELAVFGSRLPAPAIGGETRDVRNAVFKALLPGKVAIRHRGALLDREWLQSVCSKVVQRVSTRSAPKPLRDDPPIPDKSVVLVIGHLEAFRFRHVVEQLREAFPGRIGVVMGGPVQAMADEMAAVMGLSVATGAPWPVSSVVTSLLARLPPWFSGKSAYRLARRFLTGLRRTSAASAARPWEGALHRLRFHFEYYCRYRWPVFHSKTYAYWRDLWKRIRPEAVIISGFWSTYHLAAVLSAKSEGIPTMVIPHGAVGLLEGSLRTLFVMDHVLYETATQQRMYCAAEAPQECLIECRGLIADNEYAMTPLAARAPGEKRLVLVLLEPTFGHTALIPHILLKAQIEALSALGDPPRHLKDELDVRFKVHPYYPDMEIIAAAGERLADRVLPTDTDLRSVLDDAWLVIAANYGGSALMHVMRTGQPVIQFITDDTREGRFPAFSDLFREGCERVRTRDELWDAVTRLLTDPEAYREASARTARFCREHAECRDAPGIAEVVRRCVTGWRADDRR